LGFGLFTETEKRIGAPLFAAAARVPFTDAGATRGSALSRLHVAILQIANSLCQLSQRTRFDGVPSLLEVHDCRPSDSGFAREFLVGELFRFGPDLI